MERTTTTKTRARQAGVGTRSLLLVLLVLLVGAGAWNHQRNLAAEQQVFRPYRSYSDAELAELRDAYRQELERLEGSYQAARRPAAGKGDPQGLQGRVDAFERARKSGERVRSLGSTVAEREAALRDLETEERLRATQRDRLRTFLRRLLSV